MRSVFRLPALLTRPIGFVFDTTVALLALPVRVLGLVAHAERTLTAVNDAVTRVDQLTASAAPLLESYSEPLRLLEPTVRRIADTTAPREVDALVTLIDRLPRLAHAMDGEVIPLLNRIEKIGPDLDRLLDNVCDLNHMMNRIPRVFRRQEDSPVQARRQA